MLSDHVADRGSGMGTGILILESEEAGVSERRAEDNAAGQSRRVKGLFLILKYS